VPAAVKEKSIDPLASTSRSKYSIFSGNQTSPNIKFVDVYAISEKE
jgi:hypothetical protein